MLCSGIWTPSHGNWESITFGDGRGGKMGGVVGPGAQEAVGIHQSMGAGTSLFSFFKEH